MRSRTTRCPLICPIGTTITSTAVLQRTGCVSGSLLRGYFLLDGAVAPAGSVASAGGSVEPVRGPDRERHRDHGGCALGVAEWPIRCEHSRRGSRGVPPGPRGYERRLDSSSAIQASTR